MTCGKSCGKGVHDISEANNGQKMPFIFDFKHQVPSDLVVSSFFTSEMGNIVRTYSRVCYERWMKVPALYKKELRKKLRVSLSLIQYFHCSFKHSLAYIYVDNRYYLLWTYLIQRCLNMLKKKMAKLYSQFRHRLHRHHLSCGWERTS